SGPPPPPESPLSDDGRSRTAEPTLAEGQRPGSFRSGDVRAMADELTSLLDGLGITVLTGVMDTETFTTRLRSYLHRSIMHRSIMHPDIMRTDETMPTEETVRTEEKKDPPRTARTSSPMPSPEPGTPPAIART